MLVADVEFGGGQITAMLKIVKQINPQMLAIVATQASDSELVIELINQAQIFRLSGSFFTSSFIYLTLLLFIFFLTFAQSKIICHQQKCQINR